MKHVKVADDVHKRLMDDRDSVNVSASDVIRSLYNIIDDKNNDPDDDSNSWQGTYRQNGVTVP